MKTGVTDKSQTVNASDTGLLYVTGMAGKGLNRISKWPVWAGSMVALAGAVLMLGLVVNSYVARDVVRMRGIVLSLFLLGAAAIIWTEGRQHTPPHHLPR